MILRILILIFLSQSIFAQKQVSMLTDSLANANTDAERSSIGMKIASELESSDWERAQYYLDLAENNAIKSESKRVLADFYYSAGDLYFGKDALDIALRNYLKAYEYYRDRPASERFRLENNLAIMYAKSENEDEALKYFRKVFNYQIKQRDSIRLAQIYNNMGTLFLTKQVDSSLLYFNRSKLLAKKLNDPSLDLFVYTNLGRVHLKKKDTVKAKSMFRLADALKSDSLDRSAKAWLYNEMADLYLQTRQNDSVVYYASLAKNILDSHGRYSIEHYRSVRLLYKGYKEIAKYEEAVALFELYNEIGDSLNIEDKRVNVERLLIEEDYKSREKLQLLKQGKIQFRNYIIILTLIVILLIVILLVIRYKSSLHRTRLENDLIVAKQDQLNTNLQLKNKELIGKAMIEIHRSEIIEEILQELKDIRRKALKKETQHAIDSIAKRLERDTETDIWKEFELRFEQVHESFYDKLLQNHPGLTIGEKRLCALLKLNLTSKEISQVTGQSLRSIENARTRLRKKLDLTHSNTDISTYLSQL